MTVRKTQRLNFQLAFDNILPPREAKEILEFGCRYGKSLELLYKMARDRPYKFSGFDSFVGFPHDWVDKHGKLLVPRHKTTLSPVDQQEVIEMLTTRNIDVYKGFFEDTVTEYLNTDPGYIALLHMDADLYSSTIHVLEKLRHLLIPGSIIVFDEWYYKHSKEFDDHEAKAFKEFVEKYNIKYEFINLPFERDVRGDVEQKTVRILTR